MIARDVRFLDQRFGAVVVEQVRASAATAGRVARYITTRERQADQRHQRWVTSERGVGDVEDATRSVGLSQVRETAIFSGIQITERLQDTERTCGVWVVDIERGQVVAFLKFGEAVQEIFAVCLLPVTRFPDLINDNAELIGSSFVLPDAALRDVPAELRCQ